MHFCALLYICTHFSAFNSFCILESVAFLCILDPLCLHSLQLHSSFSRCACILMHSPTCCISRDEWPSPVSHVCVCVCVCARSALEAHWDSSPVPVLYCLLYCTRSLESGLSDACRRACLCPLVRAWPAVYLIRKQCELTDRLICLELWNGLHNL